LEPKAPIRNDLRARIVAPAVVTALLVFPAVPAAAGAGGPEPDAAPQGPAVAPDPAPAGASEPPPPTEQPAPAPPPQRPAPAPVQQPAAPEPAATQGESEPRTTAKRRQAHPARHRMDGDVAAAQAESLVAIRALLPDGPTADDSSPHLVLIAAGALLALVLASGSMLSVASRIVKGQLR
jgi:hypothetical protein